LKKAAMLVTDVAKSTEYLSGHVLKAFHQLTMARSSQP
jgi:hypothetical protein